MGAKSKTDVLDFVISFIVEHEKRMDHYDREAGEDHGEAREEEVRSQGTKRESPVKVDNPEPGTFTISIHNPEDFDPIKSIRIEWKDTGKVFHPDDLEFDSILKDIEYTLRDDGRD